MPRTVRSVASFLFRTRGSLDTGHPAAGSVGGAVPATTDGRDAEPVVGRICLAEEMIAMPGCTAAAAADRYR